MTDRRPRSPRSAPPCRSLAVLGTMSDAGKTTLAAGLCRVLANGGTAVAPFKAQNMSNNAAPALLPGGGYGEIGTAQALQAEACRVPPRVEMNPVLLKSGGRRDSDGAYLCSVVVLGQQIAREDYGTLGARTDTLLSLAVGAHDRLAETADAVVIEGAGSCTELNLMARDIVNLPLVRILDCPWVLVANIDCGGVFAQIVGTRACLPPSDWHSCVGIVVNKLRGEAKYFEPGPTMIEEMVGKPVFVVPYLYDLNLPEEDGLGIERRLAKEYTYAEADRPKKGTPDTASGPPRVVVIAYPHLSIADDLCPLEADPRFAVQWRRETIPPPHPHTTAVVLPGSRLTRTDLAWLTRTGWGEFLVRHVRAGGAVLGLCGGYQMLGRVVDDPGGAEGAPGATEGLGLLPTATEIAPAECKIVAPRKAALRRQSGRERIAVEGFELHCGRTEIISDGDDRQAVPLLRFENGEEGGLSVGTVRGTYLHGILRSADARYELLAAHDERFSELQHLAGGATEDPLDRLASHLENCGLNYETVSRLAGL